MFNFVLVLCKSLYEPGFIQTASEPPEHQGVQVTLGLAEEPNTSLMIPPTWNCSEHSDRKHQSVRILKSWFPMGNKKGAGFPVQTLTSVEQWKRINMTNNELQRPNRSLQLMNAFRQRDCGTTLYSCCALCNDLR